MMHTIKKTSLLFLILLFAEINYGMQHSPYATTPYRYASDDENSIEEDFLHDNHPQSENLYIYYNNLLYNELLPQVYGSNKPLEPVLGQKAQKTDLSSDAIIERILKDIQTRLSKNINPSTLAPYIKVFQKLQENEQLNNENQAYEAAEYIIYGVLRGLCRNTIAQKLRLAYQSLANQLSQAGQLPTAEDIVQYFELNKTDTNFNFSTQEQQQILQALAQLYANNQKLTELIQGALKILHVPAPAQKSSFMAQPISIQTPQKTSINEELKKLSQEADRLTKAAYFSPEMQQAVLQVINKDFTINIQTGFVQNLPNAKTIIQAIGTVNDKQAKINALYAALEATHIAIFIAGIEAAYANPGYIFTAPRVHPELIKILTQQKKDLNDQLYNIYPNWVSQAATSVYDFIFGTFSIHNSRALLAIPLTNNQTIYTIEPKLLAQIVKKNSYTNYSDYDTAANLLFKQCFIAQQHNISHGKPILPINIKEYISASNYIFNNFPDIQSLCDAAENLVAKAQNASATKEKIVQAKDQAHELLLNIRQAIQTALYIANKNSSFYLGYVFSPTITAYLDGIVNQLMLYDTKLSILCKDINLGATAADSQRDIIWTRISLLAAGLAIGATIDFTQGFGTSAQAISTGINVTGKEIYNLATLPFANSTQPQVQLTTSTQSTPLTEPTTEAQNPMPLPLKTDSATLPTQIPVKNDNYSIRSNDDFIATFLSNISL